MRDDFIEVTPSERELEAWDAEQRRRGHGPRRAPKRAQCVYCGTRIWWAGLGIGSHVRACAGRSVPAQPAEPEHHAAGHDPGCRFCEPTVTTVTAEEVQPGDFLLGLDNGYVFAEPEAAHERLCWDVGHMAVAVDETLVMISFHTAQGDEAYLIVPGDMPVLVKHEESFVNDRCV